VASASRSTTNVGSSSAHAHPGRGGCGCGWGRQWVRWLLPGVLASLVLTLSSLPLAHADEPLDRVGHLIVIYEENHSFDNYFGRFPGADGLASAGSAAIQVDKQGQPYTTLPAPLADAATGQTTREPDPRFPPDLPNGPFLFNDYLEPTQRTAAIVHAYYRQQYQIDGGKMDQFATWSDGAGMVMGTWDLSNMPLYQLARQYTLADHFFHAAFGGSFLNHQWLICACTPVYPDAPASMISSPLPGDPEHLQDNNLTPDGYVVNTSYTVNTPHPASARPETLIPNQMAPTIGDRLSAAGITWAWYSGGWNDAVAGHPDPLFQFHHQPFAYFANYADGTPGRAAHLKDEADFLAALRDGSLPQVTFYKPLGEDNEHPSYTTVARGQQHVAELVQAIQASPVWPDSLVIITYDENGGAWDHVGPPVIDRWGPGARVPAVIVSPFARRGFVDHTVYDTTSILASIEARWHLAPLGSRDAAAANLSNALEPSAATAPAQVP
jgi:phospholipase C